MVEKGKFVGHGNIVKFDGSTTGSWKGYDCSYCGAHTAGAVVARTKEDRSRIEVYWLQCTECGNGSVLDPEGALHPPAKFGPYIEGLPGTIDSAYEEARDCMSVQAYRACELLCRNLLMYVAVDQGADEGESFLTYVDYLSDEGYVTPPMKDWVDEIRRIGNKRAHELDPPDRNRAESTIMFTAELLRLIYEMGSLTAKYAPQKDDVSN